MRSLPNEQKIIDAARERLLGMLLDMSEDAWCCNWFQKLEFYVWDASLGGQCDDELRAADYAAAKELGIALGGWWTREADSDDPRWVEMDEWLRMFDEWKTKY